MPESMPDRLEAGTLNGPGIAGLLAGVEWLRAHGGEPLRQRERALKQLLRERLAAIPGVTLHSPAAPEGVPLVSFTLAGCPPHQLAARLDRDFGVMARAGLHCAPEAHALLGTQAQGAVRFSAGWATTAAEIEAAAAAVASIAEDTHETTGPAAG
jgi:selenocysteine lyase/cysteine desulfurase